MTTHAISPTIYLNTVSSVPEATPPEGVAEAKSALQQLIQNILNAINDEPNWQKNPDLASNEKNDIFATYGNIWEIMTTYPNLFPADIANGLSNAIDSLSGNFNDTNVLNLYRATYSAQRAISTQPSSPGGLSKALAVFLEQQSNITKMIRDYPEWASNPSLKAQERAAFYATNVAMHNFMLEYPSLVEPSELGGYMNALKELGWNFDIQSIQNYSNVLNSMLQNIQLA